MRAKVTRGTSPLWYLKHVTGRNKNAILFVCLIIFPIFLPLTCALETVLELTPSFFFISIFAALDAPLPPSFHPRVITNAQLSAHILQTILELEVPQRGSLSMLSFH